MIYINSEQKVVELHLGIKLNGGSFEGKYDLKYVGTWKLLSNLCPKYEEGNITSK